MIEASPFRLRRDFSASGLEMTVAGSTPNLGKIPCNSSGPGIPASLAAAKPVFIVVAADMLKELVMLIG